MPASHRTAAGAETSPAQWTQQTQIALDAADGAANSVSWAADAELLVGSGSLTLWATAASAAEADVRLLWRRALASPVALVLASADGALSASVGAADRLVKVWWKAAVGGDAHQCAFAYLPHPRAVAWMQWRRPAHPAAAAADNVLYTVTADRVLRVWAPVFPHDAHLLQLWAVVDLAAALPGARGALLVDSMAFHRAVEAAVASAGAGVRARETLHRLVDVANRSPEVLVVLDAHGRLGAWGLDNVGCRSRKTTGLFSIVHAEHAGVDCGAGDVRFAAFAGGLGLVVLAHADDGTISWLEARLDSLLDPAGPQDAPRFELKGVWTGHDTTVKSLVRTADGKCLLSSTEANKHLLWTTVEVGGETTLNRKSALQPHDKVERAVILDEGRGLHDGLHDSAHSGHRKLHNDAPPGPRSALGHLAPEIGRDCTLPF